jgi:hypothetical protein
MHRAISNTWFEVSGQTNQCPEFVEWRFII